MRHLVIVARDRPDLFEQLVQKFTSDPAVQVMADRRVTDRRQRKHLRLPDRRGAERRENTGDVQAALWVDGYVAVRID